MARGGKDDYLVGLGADCRGCGHRRDGDREHKTGRLRLPQGSQRGPRGAAGGQAVIDHDHAPARNPRQRAAAPVNPHPPGQFGLLGREHLRQVLRRYRQRVEQAAVVDGRPAADLTRDLGDRAHAELRLPRVTDLPGDHDVHRHRKDRGDLLRDRHAAPGQAEHQRAFGPIVELHCALELFPEEPARGTPVREGKHISTGLLPHAPGLPVKGAHGRTMEGMICLPCREHHHEECPGGTWCDCQHQPPAERAEPPLGWIRQG